MVRAVCVYGVPDRDNRPARAPIQVSSEHTETVFRRKCRRAVAQREFTALIERQCSPAPGPDPKLRLLDAHSCNRAA